MAGVSRGRPPRQPSHTAASQPCLLASPPARRSRAVWRAPCRRCRWAHAAAATASSGARGWPAQALLAGRGLLLWCRWLASRRGAAAPAGAGVGGAHGLGSPAMPGHPYRYPGLTNNTSISAAVHAVQRDPCQGVGQDQRHGWAVPAAVVPLPCQTCLGFGCRCMPPRGMCSMKCVLQLALQAAALQAAASLAVPPPPPGSAQPAGAQVDEQCAHPAAPGVQPPGASTPAARRAAGGRRQAQLPSNSGAGLHGCEAPCVSSESNVSHPRPSLARLQYLLPGQEPEVGAAAARCQQGCAWATSTSQSGVQCEVSRLPVCSDAQAPAAPL